MVIIRERIQLYNLVFYQNNLSYVNEIQSN